MISIPLTQPEQKLAQILTRDAWLHFSNLISRRQSFHVPDVPMMPRNGELLLPDELEVAQYYADFAAGYRDELEMIGWSGAEIETTIESFTAKIEAGAGITRGMMDYRFANS